MNYECVEIKRTNIQIPMTLEIAATELALVAVCADPHIALALAEYMEFPKERDFPPHKYVEVIGIDGDWAIYAKECD